MSMITELTSNNYESEINTDKPVVIDFWASWCNPCRMFAPVFDKCADELSDTAKFCKVNVDEQPSLASKFRVMSIPTLAVVKNGETVKKSVGALAEQELKTLVKEFA